MTKSSLMPAQGHSGLRLAKKEAIDLVVRFAPEYLEMLTAFRATGGGLQLPRQFLDLMRSMQPSI
jgi:hypothetical protein